MSSLRFASRYLQRFTKSRATIGKIEEALHEAQETLSELPSNIHRLMSKALRAERKELAKREMAKQRREARTAAGEFAAY